MNRRLLFAGLLGALLTPLAAASITSLLTGCGEGRFPVCHTNADCQERDAGKLGNVCVSLRCVACRYDADCAPGSICSANGTCDALDKPRPEDTDGGPGEIRSWDPTNWNECASGCTDQACISTCDRRFHTK
jgi:hypothetical protein